MICAWLPIWAPYIHSSRVKNIALTVIIQLKNAYTIMMRPNREAYLGGRRRDNRGLMWLMSQKFERNVERLGNESLRARLFEQWIDDVVARAIGDGGEKEEEVDEDENEEMKDGVESEVGG